MNRGFDQSLTSRATASPDAKSVPLALSRGGLTDALAGAQLASADGTLTYLVRAAGDRLFVQRTQRRRTGTLAVQCLLFTGPDDFSRWCADEPTRFEHPLLFDRLRRCGDDVLRRIT